MCFCSAEGHPSCRPCLSWVVLFRGGRVAGGVWDKSVDTEGGGGVGRKTELLAPGREICYCMRGCWKEDSISSVHEEGEKKEEGMGEGVETVRRGYGRRQMDGGGD